VLGIIQNKHLKLEGNKFEYGKGEDDEDKYTNE
jgi:hypothetical protein